MPLKDFLQQKGTQVNTPVQTGSLMNFLSSNNISTTTSNSTPSTIAKTKSTPVRDAFSWIGKQLNKGMGTAAVETRGVGEAIGQTILGNTEEAKNKLIEAQKRSLNVLTGKEETSFSKELSSSRQQAGISEDWLSKTLGIGADLVLDPLWVVKPVKILSKVGEVTKLGKPAKALADIIKEAPATKKLTSLFSNATSNPQFDEVVNKFRNLRYFQEGQLLGKAVELQKDLKKLSKEYPSVEKIITDELENPQGLRAVPQKMIDIKNYLKDTYGEFLQKAHDVGLNINEIKDYAPHIRTKESFVNTLKNQFGLGVKEWGTAGIEKGRKLQGTISELSEKGIDIFEKNPIVAFAKKGMAYTKAITSKEFANTVSNFALKEGEQGVEVTNKFLKGMKFLPEQAKVIDNFYQGIKPDELNVVIRGFDKIQNLWKSQALISPSYHIRNIAGNLWNNYVAGVNPMFYAKATAIQKGVLKGSENMIEQAKKLGVIDEGWYAKDIESKIIDDIKNIGGKVAQKLNPLSQKNIVFETNRKVGSAIENNSRLAHYMSKLSEGLSPVEAAKSVKKYLFDYSDLTSFERNVLKRAVPFYTWTRKNLPIQLEGLITQPAKYALPQKIVNEIESGVEQPNEKYMGQYIGENVPVRIRKNKDGNTEYFLLGNWLPYAQAIDILSNPIDNLVNMITPLVKTPYEQASDKSTFFKNTLGEQAELRGEARGEFLGMPIKNKNIQLLRNIRFLNDLNKWVDKQDPTATKDTWMVKMLNTLFGKTTTYDVGKSKYFYDRDTDERVQQYERDIKSSLKKGFKEDANKLREEMKQFIKSRK